MRKYRSSILLALLMLALCGSIIVGSTLAYFTSEQTGGENIIAASTLEAGLDWAYQLPESESGWQNAANGVLFNETSWEPNYSAARYIRVKNGGSLAFSYELNVLPTMVVEGGPELMDVIDVYYGVVDAQTPAITRSNFAQQLTRVGTMTDLLHNEHGAGYGILLPEGVGVENLPAGVEGESGTVTACIVLHMQQQAGNEYMGLSAGEGFKLQLAATQYNYEPDAFGQVQNPALPEVDGYGTEVVQPAKPAQNGVLTADVLFTSSTGVTATVPAGAKLDAGVTELKLIVTPKATSDADVTLQDGEALDAWEVRVEGLAKDNTVPVRISLGAVMQKALNIGNYDLYHVEGDATNKMTRVDVVDADAPHNSYSYDPATGEVEVAMATFSEVAVVASPAKWQGVYDYSWYTNAVMTADGDAEVDYIIANADQLAGFSAIVGGMDGQTQDSFAGKTIKLIADIDLNDGEESNAPDRIFYPIGYYNSTGKYDRPTDGTSVTSTVNSFEGIFDGNGHTISNFYQNTWEMLGDYNEGYPAGSNYYKDGMGLFGYVLNGKVCNLTVDNFISDGEFTPTGVIAAYAVNSTFENIAITNCNPRVYNTGNGGIVGIGGDSNDTGDKKLILKNITVDYTNKISALWGSWDVACGGLMGMFRGNGTVDFDNCHVAAQIDVFNDVCANYQYYWYRYSGMMIGSVRKNMSENGYTVPDPTGITFSECSATYGPWSDYVYCEFTENSQASYTEDYQFSRVDESEYYKDGDQILCKHDHKDVEDKRAVLLPFEQLFNGYGYGVKAVTEFDGVTIYHKDNEGALRESTEKFKFIGNTTLEADKEYKIGELFEYITGKPNVSSSGVVVSITDLDNTDGIVSADYSVINEMGWAENTITFTGTGRVQLIIQDYRFCTPTTVDVTIGAREAVEKFETKFTGDFLYRVGNQNGVKLDSLFKAKDGVEIGNVTVTIDTLEGTNATGTYTSNATWTNGTIQFSGTGVVKVTITDDDYCKPTELILEVINATNIISAKGTTTGGDMVLLCDVNTANYVNYWNCTLYGNGFTYSLEGAPTAYNSKQGHGVLITKNATLDNLVIVGDVYNSYGAYTNQDYYNAAIDVAGDTTIQNCYVANCAAPVKARANANIHDTTLYGGTVANLIINSGTVTLENVTTVNYDDGRNLVGMGIVIHSDATETAKLVLNDQLKQYNYICESKVPTDTYAKNLHTTMFSSNCSEYHFGTSPNRYVNTGIISLTNLFDASDITDNADTGYSGKAITVNSVNGYVYTQRNSTGTVDNSYSQSDDSHVSSVQGTVPPEYCFDYTKKNYKAKQDGSNDYCYEENGIVNISMDDGDTFNWDTSILSVSKAGSNLDYTVSMNGIDYTGKSITFNTAGDYVVVYSYTDPTNFKLDEDGNVATYEESYTKTVNITVAVVKATTKHAQFRFGSSNTASKTVTIGNSTYVMPNVSATSSTIGSTTVSGDTIYYPIVEIAMSDGKKSHTGSWYAYFPVFSGAVTITDYKDNGTGDPETFGSSTQSMPNGLSVVGDPAQLFKYQSSSAAGNSPVAKNNILVYSSPSISANRNEYNTVIQYSYQDNAGATYYYYIGYHAPAQSYDPSCVTPDTLVTLADGTKKEIQYITYGDQLLVWDFFKGDYATVPVGLIFNHEEGNYDVIKLQFDDGTKVKVVAGHRFFDVDANEFVFIDSANVQEYVGHSFVKMDENTVKHVKLIDYSVTNEYIKPHAIVSAYHYNSMVEGMFSTTFFPDWVGAFTYFDVGSNMMYDAEQMNADIEQYGLYNYDEFAEYLTPEQFDAFNVKYMKIAVGKGQYTYNGILQMIEDYVK